MTSAQQKAAMEEALRRRGSRRGLLRTSTAGSPERAGADSTSVRPEEQPDLGGEYVNLRSLHYRLANANGQKGFCLYVCYFVLYVAIVALRYDSPAGYSSVSWLQDAVDKEYDFIGDCDARAAAMGDGIDCFDPFVDRGDTEELAGFLGDDVPRLVHAVKNFCPYCQVAISRLATELDGLRQADFLCSDFGVVPAAEGLVASPTYTNLDCDAVDAAWKERPGLETPPCCGEGDHVRSSLTLRTKLYLGERAEVAKGDGSFDYGRLNDEEMSARAVADYINATLHIGGGGIAHIVIRRADHFTGVVYTAQLRDRHWLPGLVKARTAYYSLQMRHKANEPLLVFAVLFWILAVLHELLDVFVAWRAGHFAERVLSAHFLLVEVPSLVLPWLMAAVRGALRQDQHVVATSIIEVVMFVRVFTDGIVVPPLRVIVKTVTNAVRQLSMFSLVVLGTCAFFAVLNMQMFGVFEEDFRDFGTAFSAVFMIIVEGSPFEGDRFRVAPAGAYLMLFVANFAVFLMQAQFFIAILVGAFDATRESEEATESARQLPAGFEELPRAERTPQRAQARSLAVFFATYRFYGVFTWELLPSVDVAVHAAEERVQARCAERGLPYDPSSLMVSRAQLEALLGAEPAAHVVGLMGARCVAPHKAELTVLVPPPVAEEDAVGAAGGGPHRAPGPKGEHDGASDAASGAGGAYAHSALPAVHETGADDESPGNPSRRRARLRDGGRGGGAAGARAPFDGVDPEAGGAGAYAPPYGYASDPATGEPVVRARVSSSRPRDRRRAASAASRAAPAGEEPFIEPR